MPIKLVSPRAGKTPYYSGRGKHLGVYVDRSTKARKRGLALKIIRQWEQDIERGVFARPGDPTFASAALSYMQAGGERRPLTPIFRHFGETPLKLIDQQAIDSAAVTLMPDATAATRNREVYTPDFGCPETRRLRFQDQAPQGLARSDHPTLAVARAGLADN